MKRNIYLSNSFDPAVNLSYEEYLMSICDKDEIIMYLWQNKNTVVIGRNQNPIKECHLENLKEDSVKLVRRLSGGGAVYHDLGNLNFTFIAHESIYDVERQLGVILDAINSFGIDGKFSGRNDLTVSGKKFSGNSFMVDDEICCHHGTLLVNVVLKKMVNYLTPAKIKVTSKGIESVRSRVVNLKELSSDITVEKLKDQIIESFNKLYQCQPNKKMTTQNLVNTLDDIELIQDYVDKYNTQQWNFNESPKCSINNVEKFSWGTFEIDFDLENGLISKCYINTDSIIMDNFELLSKGLIGIDSELTKINKVIMSTINNDTIKNDIKHFFTNILIK